MIDHLLPPRRGNSPHIVLLNVVADHAQHDRIVLDNKDARRRIVGHTHAQVGAAKRRGSVSTALVDMRDDRVSRLATTGSFTTHLAASYETRADIPQTGQRTPQFFCAPVSQNKIR